MSLIWVIVGSLAQLCLAFFMFMLAAFAGGGIANGNSLTPMQLRILDWSLYFLPGSCVISAVTVIVLYFRGVGAEGYWWYLLPVVAVAIYFFNIKYLIR